MRKIPSHARVQHMHMGSHLVRPRSSILGALYRPMQTCKLPTLGTGWSHSIDQGQEEHHYLQ